MKKKFNIEIEVECVWDSETCKGNLHMTLADTRTEVHLGNKKIGVVTGCIGGGVEFMDGRVSKGEDYLDGTFFASPRTLWNGFQEALLREGFITKKQLQLMEQEE